MISKVSTPYGIQGFLDLVESFAHGIRFVKSAHAFENGSRGFACLPKGNSANLTKQNSEFRFVQSAVQFAVGERFLHGQPHTVSLVCLVIVAHISVSGVWF